MKSNLLSTLLVVATIAGCVFNAEEETSYKTWRVNMDGVTQLNMRKDLMYDCDISVFGYETDTLVVDATVNGLMLKERDLNLDNLRMVFTREGREGSITFSYTGDDWQLFTIEEIAMKMSSLVDLSVATEAGDVSIGGINGFITVDNTRGDIDIEVQKGCRVEAKTSNVNITVSEGDSLFTSITVIVTTGDIIITVPSSLKAALSLKTDWGDIDVPGGNRISLNGGGSTDGVISCETTSGDIKIKLN